MHKLPFFRTSASVLLACAAALGPGQLAPKDDQPPSWKDMMDSTQACGLNLPIVKKRRNWMRTHSAKENKNGGSDVSNLIIMLAPTRALLLMKSAKLREKVEAFSKAKATLKPDDSALVELKIEIKNMQTDREKLRTSYELAIKTIIADFKENELAITREQLDKTPSFK